MSRGGTNGSAAHPATVIVVETVVAVAIAKGAAARNKVQIGGRRIRERGLTFIMLVVAAESP